ncbi:transposase [Streptomyces sp. NBC_01450]|uniref:transposase n=1 Tax=Streptomyces sp. NBC_01450 TaxID=2903871 RepID=UPI003FCDE3D3
MLLPRYQHPSDTSDLAWAMLKALLPTPPGQPPKGGASEKWLRRRVVDAILHITDNGTKWRAPPADFGIPWRTAFGYFARWAKADALKRILDQLRRRLRLRLRLRLRRRCCPQLPRPQRGRSRHSTSDLAVLQSGRDPSDARPADGCRRLIAGQQQDWPFVRQGQRAF